MMKLLLSCMAMAIQLASAQHSHGMPMDETLPPFNSTGEEPMSYALFPAEKGYFYIHVIMMVLAFWILMPMGKELFSNGRKNRGKVYSNLLL